MLDKTKTDIKVLSLSKCDKNLCLIFFLIICIKEKIGGYFQFYSIVIKYIVTT